MVAIGPADDEVLAAVEGVVATSFGREVARLSAEGLNLEGIRRILELENQVSALTARVRELEAALADELLARPGRRVFAAGAAGEVVSLRAGERLKRNQVVVWRPLGPGR